jgi:hypothetical protein
MAHARRIEHMHGDSRRDQRIAHRPLVTAAGLDPDRPRPARSPAVSVGSDSAVSCPIAGCDHAAGPAPATRATPAACRQRDRGGPTGSWEQQVAPR